MVIRWADVSVSRNYFRRLALHSEDHVDCKIDRGGFFPFPESKITPNT